MELPSLYVYGTGTVPCRTDALGLCMELSLLAPTQYVNYNFDSMCKFGDVYIGCDEYGIFELTGKKDNNIDIDALVRWPTTDFGIPNQKRIRKGYLGCETSGSLVLITKDEEDNERRFILEASLLRQTQRGVKVPIGRDGKGRYWCFELENISGCDFSIDSLDVSVVVLPKKSGKISLNRARMVLPALECCGVGS